MNPKIKSSFWTDGDIEKQPAEIKLTALWLITNSTTSAIGVCDASTRRFKFETELDGEWIGRACHALPNMFVQVDEVIFVRNYIRHQHGDGPALKRNTLFRTIIKQVEDLKSENVRDVIIQEYPVIEQFLKLRNDGDGKGMPSPKNKDNANAKDRAKAKGEEDSKGEEGKLQTRELTLEIQPRRNGHCDVEATEIYDAYPHKVGKPEGIKAIKKQLTKYPAQWLLERTRLYADTPKDPRFIPYPATWFNQQRFADDPQTWRQHNPKPSAADLRAQLAAIERLMAEHPCHPNGPSYDENTTEAQKVEYRKLWKNHKAVLQSIASTEII